MATGPTAFTFEKTDRVPVNYRVLFGRLWVRTVSAKRGAEKLARLLNADPQALAWAGEVAACLTDGREHVRIWHLAAGNVVNAKSRGLTPQERAVDLLYERVQLLGAA